MDLSCNYAPLLPGANLFPNPESADSTERLSPELHTSNLAFISPSVGGVGHNVALAAQRAGGDVSVRLCSVIADDL